MQDQIISTTSSTPLTSSSKTPSRRASGKKTAVVATVSVLGVAALAGGALFAGANRAAADALHVAPGIKVAGVPVGGMTREQAESRVKDWARKQNQKPVTLVAPRSGRRWNITLAEAGGRFDVAPAVEKAFAVGKDDNFFERAFYGARERNLDVPVPFHLSETTLDKQIARVGKIIHVAPQNARAKLAENNTLVLTHAEERGINIDADATKAALLSGGPDGLRDGKEVKLVIREEKPAVTSEDLGKVNALLASFHTDFSSSSSNRQHNVQLAAAKINGTLLAPGEVFSYNDIVGERSRSLGWKDAPTYQDGQVVPGPGGGVCQVSTTLYNAVLRANLKIVQRKHHSMPVHYVNPGSDATVAYGDIDFQFANSTDSPMLVAAKSTGGRLTFSLFGKEPETRPQVSIVTGESRGNRSGGFTVSTYRVVKNADGTESRETLSTDSYMPLIKRSTVASRPRRTRAKRPTVNSTTAPKTNTPSAPTETIKPAVTSEESPV